MQPDTCIENLCTSERLAYWYFRLNGFMTIENFLVHPETGSEIRTEVDILATRFANRQEKVGASMTKMTDDPQVAECQTFANVIIAEVTRDECKLNGPWTNPGRKNMERVLLAIGCVSEDEVDRAAQLLYKTGKWSNGPATVRLFAVGEKWNDQQQKASNGQWPKDGVHLRDLALSTCW